MFSRCNLSLYGGHRDEINCLVYSRDLEILLTGSIYGCIRIWNTVNEHLTLKIQETTGRIRGLDISNNDKYFASIANDIHIRLYETRTGNLLHLLSGHTHPSDCVQFSSDSQLIATGAWDNRTIVWNVLTGEQIYNFHDHTNAVQSIAFHPNKNVMASGSHDHNIYLYNLETLSKPDLFQGHFNNIRALAFSNLPYFASAGWDKIIIIWHIETKRITSRLLSHTGWIQAISFHDDDGSILASVDDDSVCISNVITGCCLHRLTIDNDLSCFVRFLPNNNGLIVGGAVYELSVKSHILYQLQKPSICKENITSKTKLILFWTKIFSSQIDESYLNNLLFKSSGRCKTDLCQITNNRNKLCNSDAVIFHARGGIKMYDMPRVRSPHQRYVLLTKEPPYKTTAIVGHLDYFFNWTATYRIDSDIEYRYFRWRRKELINSKLTTKSYLNNRQARAASMISNCYSHNNREEYLERLNSIIPVTRLGFCSSNKCRHMRNDCLNQLADTNPFYLAFENSLCQDYVTEKYANVIMNNRMIPIVFSKNSNLYIPNSFIDANLFSSPENLGQYLLYLVNNQTAYDSYFQWQNQYEIIIPDEYDYLCELCQKLNNPKEPKKIYYSMKNWLYDDAKCQRWISKLNKTIDISVDETMDYEDPWF